MFYQTTTLDRIGWCSSNTDNVHVNYIQPEEEYDVPEDWNSEPTDNGWYRGADGGLYEDFEQSIGE